MNKAERSILPCCINDSRALAAWYREHRSDDWMGGMFECILPYLDYEDAEPFISPEISRESWEAIKFSLDRDAILSAMQNAMEFAWDKVKGHRGISAGRSIDKMTAWLFILGDLDLIDGVPYEQYGAPILARICEKYQFPIPDYHYIRRMIAGKPCRDGCDQGCGR